MKAADLIHGISRASARATKVGPFVRQAGCLVTRFFGVALVEITVENQDTGKIIHWSSGDQLPKFDVSLILSRNIAVRGVTYGRIEIGAVHTEPSKAEAMELLDVVAQQIALFAELRVAESMHLRLKNEIDLAEQNLRLDKIVTRAAGIVADVRKLSSPAALSWLRTESLQSGKSLARLAEEIIAHSNAEREDLRAPWRQVRRIA